MPSNLFLVSDSHWVLSGSAIEGLSNDQMTLKGRHMDSYMCGTRREDQTGGEQYDNILSPL